MTVTAVPGGSRASGRPKRVERMRFQEGLWVGQKGFWGVRAQCGVTLR